MELKPTHRGTCHCGAVEFTVDLPNGLLEPRRCNCSMCRRRGAIVASVPLAAFHLIRGAAELRCYQFGTMTAEHYFCSKCGIYTHHKRRSNPHQYGFNVACLDGVDPFELEPVTLKDGVHHPADA